MARAGSAVATGGTAGGAPTAVCDAWTGDLAAQNQNAVAQHGFFESRAILEGTLGDRFDESGSSWARFTIAKVRAGVTSYEGREIAIAMGPGLHAAFGAGASVLVGLTSTYPNIQATVSVPTWSNLIAMVKRDQVALPEDVLGFRAWHAPNVAVIRVTELTDWGFVFAIVETVAGSIPTTFDALSWPSSRGPLPVRVGDERLIGVTATGNDLVELRPNNAEERARALRGIAALAPGGFVPRYRAELDAARADAVVYRFAWTFGRADRVLGVEVAGLSGECCTDAGGIYFANTVTDVLRGDAPAGPVLTGGHGVYNDEHCGDRFLYALRSVMTLSAESLASYACTRTTQTLRGAASGVDARLPYTPANRDDVNLWLRSAPPLLRLFPPGVAAPAGAFTPPSAPALLSVPVPALTAIVARHRLALLTIVDVQPQPGGGYAVQVRTPLYVRELATLTNRDATLYVPCADPRLLEVGRRWVGAVMATEPSYGGGTSELVPLLDQQRLMLVPGFLLPEEREDLVRTADALTNVGIPRPLGP